MTNTQATPQPTKPCPGYGEDCGTPIPAGNDLCGDDTMARLDAESPRVPR